MPTDENRATTQALEDGEVRYEETEFCGDEPELNLLARWCERQAKTIEAAPTGQDERPAVV